MFKDRIRNFALSPITAYLVIRDTYREMKYEEMIAESQAKIGPYKPATIPVQVWA